MVDLTGRRRDPLADKRLLIGLGAQKSGTTWVSDYLHSHPDVFMSPLKELHYFDLKYVPEIRAIQEGYFLHRMKKMAASIKTFSEVRERSHAYRQLKNYVDRFEMQSVDDYLDFFRSRVGDQKVCCEISPGYALLETEHYEEIYSMHADVRVFFIMRDPIERYWSNLRFYEGILANFDAREKFIECLTDTAIFGRTNYPRTLDALDRVIAPEHQLILFYETLFSQDTIDHLTAFAGIAPKAAQLDKSVLKSAEIPISDAMKRTAYDHLRPIYEGMYQRTAGALPDAWLESMRQYGGEAV